MADSYVQLPADGTGKKLATKTWTQGADTVNGQGVFVCDSSGNVVSVTSNRLLVDGSGVTQPVSAASLPLPSGAATDATLTGGTQKSKLVDTGGTNVASVSAAGALKVDNSGVTQPVSGTFWQTTQPVSGTVTANAGTGTMAVSGPLTDTQLRAARVPIGISDGTDEATVIPRGTAPTASDKALAVTNLIARLPTYQVVTAEITSATATGVKEILTGFKASSSARDVFILEIGVNFRVVQTAGTFAFELQFISAENGTPGGTAVTAQPLNRGDSASDVTWRTVVTGAPTTAGQIFQRASFPLPAAATPLVGPGIEGMVLFKANSPEDAIEFRASQGDGLRISQNIIATLTQAPIFNVYARYIERA